jgi:uncharacterized membrane protein
VSGVLWATASGIGFGLFQSLNRRAIRGIEDPYVSTFLQLAVATGILVVASVVSEDLSQLGDASGKAIALFALAGIIHFVLGWLLLNVSQMRIGASRTAPLITLTPLFGVALAAVALRELPSAAALLAIAPIMVGAWLLASRGSGDIRVERDSIFAFGTAFMWALSAVLTVEALEGLDSCLLRRPPWVAPCSHAVRWEPSARLRATRSRSSCAPRCWSRSPPGSGCSPLARPTWPWCWPQTSSVCRSRSCSLR